MVRLQVSVTVGYPSVGGSHRKFFFEVGRRTKSLRTPAVDDSEQVVAI